ncbi:MAG: FixH family protein [Gammaproteobacteria bacterium]
MTNNSKRISQDNPHAWRNPWVLGWIALVVVVLAVNIGMISLAFITNPGLVTEDYYEKGIDYEENFNKRQLARNALGWSYRTEFPTSPVMNTDELYRFSIVDKVGRPLSDAKVSISVYRPSDVSADFNVHMLEVAPGVYQSKMNYPLKGFWELTVQIERGEDEYYFSRRTSVLAE